MMEATGKGKRDELRLCRTLRLVCCTEFVLLSTAELTALLHSCRSTIIDIGCKVDQVDSAETSDLS